MIPIRSQDGAVTFSVRVQPRARKNALQGQAAAAVKLALTAPPVEGAANAACIEFFSKLLKVPRSSISIIAGETHRNKVVRIAGISVDQLQQALAPALGIDEEHR